MSTNIIINRSYTQFFIDNNKLSAFRVYLYAKTYLNNHIHLSDFNKIQQFLNIKRPTLLKCLKQLEDLKVGSRVSLNYFRINSWKSFTGGSKQSEGIVIDINNIKSIKLLRNLYYKIATKTAHKVSRYLSKSKGQKTETSCDFRDLSGSFIASSANITTTERTIRRHIRQLDKNRELSVKPNKIFLSSFSNLSEAQLFKRYYSPTFNYKGSCIKASLSIKKFGAKDYSVYAQGPNQISLVRQVEVTRKPYVATVKISKDIRFYVNVNVSYSRSVRSASESFILYSIMYQGSKFLMNYDQWCITNNKRDAVLDSLMDKIVEGCKLPSSVILVDRNVKGV